MNSKMGRGGLNNMSEVLGKRESRPPRHLRADFIFDSTSGASTSTVRGNREKSSGRNGFKANLKGKHSVKPRNPRYQEESDDSDDSDDSDSDSTMPDEVNEGVKENRDRINYFQSNCEVALRFIISVLPITCIQKIANEIKTVESDDHVILQDFIEQVLNSNSPNQGKDITNKNGIDTGTERNEAVTGAGQAAATTTAAGTGRNGRNEAGEAGSDSGSGSRRESSLVNSTPLTGPSYAAVAGSDLEAIIEQRVTVRIDDINRKKIS